MGREANAEDDRDLVRRCRAGEEPAFEELVRKYQQTVFNLIYHSTGRPNDVEDIAQKIFAKVYFSLPKFDVNRPFFPLALPDCRQPMLRRAAPGKATQNPAPLRS